MNTEANMKAEFSRRIAELPPEKREALNRLRQGQGSSSLLPPPIHKRSGSQPVPLSFAQQRLWFLDRLNEGDGFYNIDSAIRLNYELDCKVVERTLNEIVRRHEALRTAVQSVDGQPYQVVAPIVSLKVPFIDLRHLSPQERDLETARLALAEARKPFDLMRAPLIRATLLGLGPEECVFLLTVHHIVSDGLSMQIISEEFDRIYDAFQRGRPSPLAELPIQYSDFAVWQRQWLTGEVLEAQLGYWKKQLDHAPVLELRPDRPRPAVQSFRGAFCSKMIPQDVAAALRSLSQGEGVTLFMTMLAAFQALLYRYSGQDDIVTGVPIAGRTRPELQGLVGFFVNTLVIRTSCENNPTFTEFLERVRKVALGAYGHQEVPFERIVDELQIGRDLSRNPLFQIVFQLFSTADGSGHVGGGGAECLEVQTGRTTFDLSVGIIETAEGLDTRFDYATDLFDRQTIECMSQHFVNLVRAVATNPECRLSDLPILTEDERQMLLHDWNRTEVSCRDDTAVHKMFAAQAERTPEALALATADRKITYEELRAQSRRLARFLTARGVKRDTIVAVCLERSIEMVVAFLGILEAGGAYLPIDPDYPRERIISTLKDACPVLLITRSELAEKIGHPQKEVFCVDSDQPVVETETIMPSDALDSSSLAYLIYTSGSTGTPRGVAIEHRGLMNLVSWHHRTYAVTSSDRAAQIASPSFDASVWEIWPYLTAGASIHFPDEYCRISASKLIGWLQEQRITITFVPTPLLESMMEEPWPANSHLRALLTGGDRLRRWRGNLPCALWNHYGPTENTVVATWAQVTAPTSPGGLPPIGRPIDNVQAYVLDKQLQPVPVGAPGELCIAGKSLARGYWNCPVLTDEKFVLNPFDTNSRSRLYRTGDLVRYGKDGSIEFLGRLDQQVKIRGFRIEPGEIEAVLAQHRAVREVAVTTHERGSGERMLVAHVACHPDKTGDRQELRMFLEGLLPGYMIPSAIVFLDSLPLTPHGKVDRAALASTEVLRDVSRNFVAPRNDLERTITSAWKTILELPSVGVHNNFFDLGGHSLLIVKLHALLRSMLGMEVSIVDLFRFPTVSSLARSLSKPEVRERATAKNVSR